MHPSPLTNTVMFHLGRVPFTETVVVTWVIMLLLTLGSWLITRKLERHPGLRQSAVEGIVAAILAETGAVIPRERERLLPLLGTIFLFLAAANLSGVVPGVQAPTSRLETPATLALIVFCSVHYFGIRTLGIRRYLASFARPKLIMLPLNVLAQLTRTFSLMVRLFGNVMSGEFVIALVVAVAGLLVPIPLMALEILVGLVQAYIFTVLASVFIGAAMSGEEG